VQVFVLYHDPDRTESVPHSLGLEKGMLGVVYAFAARRATAPNGIVIAHELMHPLGATDKYDPATDEPRFPEGYADPERKPLLAAGARRDHGGPHGPLPQRLGKCPNR